ncbi:MAG: HD domain-containing protein [Chloroflexi bacterium]|nr:HD domain-containing protein [Chloroflexota bacterium]
MDAEQFKAVNLISDPIHGYIELTKRLTAEGAAATGHAQEEAAEEDLLDSPWLQRLRRISQLQSARWVFPTAEHSRFSHGLGVMHEAGLWARHLYPSLATRLTNDGETPPSEGLVVETLRVAGLLHDVGHGPFAHFFDHAVLEAFPAPADPRRPKGKRLAHEDLSALIIERELAPIITKLRRAPGDSAARDAFAKTESIDPRWVSFLISKPPLEDPTVPAWVRIMQPLLSGVFTVDNLDYVRRDSYMTGVRTAAVDVERLRHYSFIGARGLTLYEPAVGALESFLGARQFLYLQVYLHRTVRGIDLDMKEAFAPGIRAIFGDTSPADDLAAYLELDEYTLLHQAARWSRGQDLSPNPQPKDGTVTPAVADAWRAVLFRSPRWQMEEELRADYFEEPLPHDLAERLGTPIPGEVEIDVAYCDPRHVEGDAADRLLAVEGPNGREGRPISSLILKLPLYSVVARRYRRR